MNRNATPTSRPMTAVVMNLFYTGLGIARSLGERGIPVVGLTAVRVYGNYSRYLRTVRCADSRHDPETLLAQMITLGQQLGAKSVLFPTRDHDLVFIDRFRDKLEPYFSAVIPSRLALDRSLNKWETYRYALDAEVATPRSWLVQGDDDLRKAADEVRYPCVLKPVAAHHWRSDGNWALVGARKAIEVSSADALFAEYATVTQANRRMLVQESIPGDDDCLIICACYIDRKGNLGAAFNTQKVVQDPPGFGTGCIVQSADRPELIQRTLRLLRAMAFTGIAEVEYKWDAESAEYKLIEVNPRPWDQHRLGTASGVDLMHLAYCEHAGLSMSVSNVRFTPCKWIAEDAFLMVFLRMLWRRDPALGGLLRQARGRKMYGIWCRRDPLPFVAYLATLVPTLAGLAWQALTRLGAAVTAARHKTAIRATQ